MGRHKTRYISRREFVSTAAAGAFIAGSSKPSLSTTFRPNVLFILADDLGYGDLSCDGQPDYRTPNLDQLAKDGLRFTNAYSASPVCTPTRCAFITGRYPARTPVGLEEPLKANNDRVGLDQDHPTIASLLKGNDYETALVGKWHLGLLPEHGPNRHGFAEFFGLLSGAVDYFTHQNGLGKPDLYEDLVPVERIGYLTDLLSERAVKFISRRRARPFYLSLHFTAPHWPWQGPKEGEAIKFAENEPEWKTLSVGGSLRIYAAMIKSLDDGIGRVMKALGTAKLDRDTLVIFTSDNGGERFSYHWPLSGQKEELLEGGVRVPAIVRWPGVVPANRSTHQVAITMDWTATILAATHTKPDPNYPLDGQDLLPVIRGTRPVYDRTIFWRTQQQDALRSGKWKYLRQGKDEYLFDLSVDEREQADLKEKNRDVLNRLRSEFEKWQTQMLPRPGTR